MSELSRQFDEIFAKLRVLSRIGTPLSKLGSTDASSNSDSLKRVIGPFLLSRQRLLSDLARFRFSAPRSSSGPEIRCVAQNRRKEWHLPVIKVNGDSSYRFPDVGKFPFDQFHPFVAIGTSMIAISK
jgi:hypothetical protein